jgi:hypothetical protein
MTETQTASPTTQAHTVIIDEATYEVVSNYTGNTSLLDLLKQMLKRDLERPEE